MILAGPGKYAVPNFNPEVTTSTQTQNNQQNQTYAASTSSSSNNKENYSTTASSPGFEYFLFIIGIITVVIIRKFKFRRNCK